MGESAVGGGEREWNKQVICIPVGNLNSGGYGEYTNDANDMKHFERSAAHTASKTACTTACTQTGRNSHNERNTKVQGVCRNELIVNQRSNAISRALSATHILQRY